jgi:hypothetical protein
MRNSATDPHPTPLFRNAWSSGEDQSPDDADDAYSNACRLTLLKRNMKNSNEWSLRSQVEKWLAPGPAMAVHVTEFSRNRWDGRRYVCVETSSPSGSHALFFFRHDDGSWYVLPPTAGRPKSTAERAKAQVAAVRL